MQGQGSSKAPRAINFNDFGVIRVGSEFEYEWGNSETSSAFRSMRERLISDYSHYDRFIRHSENISLVGLIDKQLVEMNPAELSPKEAASLKWLSNGYLFQSLFFCLLQFITDGST